MTTTYLFPSGSGAPAGRGGGGAVLFGGFWALLDAGALLPTEEAGTRSCIVGVCDSIHASCDMCSKCQRGGKGRSDGGGYKQIIPPLFFTTNCSLLPVPIGEILPEIVNPYNSSLLPICPRHTTPSAKVPQASNNLTRHLHHQTNTRPVASTPNILIQSRLYFHSNTSFDTKSTQSVASIHNTL